MKLDKVLATKGDFVATVAPGATVAQLVRALAEHNVGALVVSEDGVTILGMVSERDVVRALRERGTFLLDASVSEIMTPHVQTATPDTTTAELMLTMTNARIRHIPVIDEAGELTGIISIGDVVKSRIDELEDERSALIQYVTS